MTTAATTTQTVRQVFAAVIGDQATANIDDEAKLFEDHLVDSLHLVELIDRLEAAFRIRVEPDELSPENFESIAAMSRYVGTKTGG